MKKDAKDGIQAAPGKSNLQFQRLSRLTRVDDTMKPVLMQPRKHKSNNL